jgi:putative ABC transport system permease protein
MSFFEGIRLALSGLAANRMRAVLTTLGIVIGVASVVSLISLGRGVQNYIASEFESLGANLLVVFPQRPTSPTRTRIQFITTNEARDLMDRSIAPSIADIAMDYRINGVAKAGSESFSTDIIGTTPNFASVRTWQVRDGAFLTQDDLDNRSRVAVLGVNAVEELYGFKEYNPVGQIIRLNERNFTVIGVMTEIGSSFTNDDDVVFIPLTTAQTRLSRARALDGGYQVHVLWISARGKEYMDSATTEIENYLNESHHIVFDGEQDFMIANQADVLATVGQITGLLTIVLGMISSISLLVGGIGIMNIMLVSVTERTREIGLRKAVGARGGDIMSQFLIESVVLSIMGGLIGISISFGVTVLVTNLVPDLKVALTADAVMLATGVSSMVGIFFGLYPANRAARMRPIDALRYE